MRQSSLKIGDTVTHNGRGGIGVIRNISYDTDDVWINWKKDGWGITSMPYSLSSFYLIPCIKVHTTRLSFDLYARI